jgi:hypothetical protein
LGTARQSEQREEREETIRDDVNTHVLSLCCRLALEHLVPKAAS